MSVGGQNRGWGGPGVGEFFQIFRSGQARTKAELASETGLARSTVSLRVDALLSAGLLQPAGEAASSGGRPPAKVSFNPLARVVIAVDLGATHGVIALSDLAGTILASRSSSMPISAGPEAVLDLVTQTSQELLEAGGFDLQDVWGMGIGVPGPVEHSTGRAINPPIMPGWDSFDIPSYVQKTFAIPILVDNDVNLLALGEHATVWQHVNDLIFIKVATGIGAGIIAGGKLQRGAQGTAGDIGHVRVPYSSDSPRDPADERDLEAIASGPAIVEGLASPSSELNGVDDFVRLVRSGNSEAVHAIRQAGREIGEVLASMVNILNPSVIVVGGKVAHAGEDLLAGIREIVYRRSTPLATQHLGIVTSRAGELAGVLGAAILVIHHVLSADWIEAKVGADPNASPSGTIQV